MDKLKLIDVSSESSLQKGCALLLKACAPDKRL